MVKNSKKVKIKQSPRWLALQILAAIVLIMWAVFALQSFFGFEFDKLGILPRNKQGLLGIFLSPFIHSNIEHIGYNTLALVFVSLVLALSFPKRFILIFLVLLTTTGVLVWIFARSAYHIGMSGVIFALIGYTVAYGIVRRSFLSIVLAILVGLTYGGLLYGILPLKLNVSWESHLLGIISGVFWGIIFGSIDYKKAKLLKTEIESTTE